MVASEEETRRAQLTKDAAQWEADAAANPNSASELPGYSSLVEQGTGLAQAVHGHAKDGEFALRRVEGPGGCALEVDTPGVQAARRGQVPHGGVEYTGPRDANTDTAMWLKRREPPPHPPPAPTGLAAVLGPSEPATSTSAVYPLVGPAPLHRSVALGAMPTYARHAHMNYETMSEGEQRELPYPGYNGAGPETLNSVTREAARQAYMATTAQEASN